jgi:Zn-dependent peptidase ImmA (M78 family)
VLSWVYRELKAPSVGFTQHNVAKSAADVAAETRRLIRVDVQRQLDAKSNSEAFHLWREATEAFGVHVLVSSMGQNACRGFSVWDEYAPMIVVNSAWNVEARTFTLLHELGHLLTRTSSLCLETGSELVPPNDDTERWCEIFAAALLLPEQSVREHLNEIGATDVTDLGTATRIARKYRVSLRAATLRLISLGVARWPLYRAIPAASDRKREGGGGGGGRTREEIRRDHFGVRTFDVFGEALRREVLTYGDVVDYLDAPSAADAGGVLTLSGND